jgi:two-component system, LytTR family, response regulator
MRVLIVDDEPIARKILREELECIDSVDLVGEADNGKHALLKIASLKPDLVLLDIQMPIMNGFEVIDCLRGGYIPVVIVVTAYDQHAIRAFEAGAVDYLLKPIRQARLLLALERAKAIARNPLRAAENLATLQEAAHFSKDEPKVQKVIGKLGAEYFLLNPKEILAFQAEGDVTWIITAKQRYIATQNLRSLEQRLPTGIFSRIHRNTLVNVEHIRKMSALSSQRWLLTLNNGQEFVVSKRQAKNVHSVLSW